MSNVDLDLWEEILTLLAASGHEVHWPQVPSHTGICGNHKVDERRMYSAHVRLGLRGSLIGRSESGQKFSQVVLRPLGVLKQVV